VESNDGTKLKAGAVKVEIPVDPHPRKKTKHSDGMADCRKVC